MNRIYFLFSLLCMYGYCMQYMQNPIEPEADAIRAAVIQLKVPVKQEQDAAILSLLKLSKVNPQAFYYLGLLFQDGTEQNPKNPLLAYKYMEKAAQGGYAHAYLKLAEYAETGFGTEINYLNAEDCYQKYLQTPQLPLKEKQLARYELAKLYLEHFKDDPQRVAAAIKDLERLAENFNYSAIFLLGQYYEYTLKDIKKAEKYFLTGVQKSPLLKTALASLYFSNYNNNPAKIALAEQYAQDALAQGEQMAGYILARHYYKQEKSQETLDVLKNVSDPKFLLDKYLFQGLTYLYGKNIPADLPRAFEFFNKALTLKPGNQMALYGLWCIWRENPEIVSDEKIKEILPQLLATNDPHVAYELAVGYSYGIYGLDKNLDLANHYFSQVLKDTTPESAKFRALLYAEGLGTQKNYAQAFEILARMPFKNKDSQALLEKIQRIQTDDLLQQEQAARATQASAAKPGKNRTPATRTKKTQTVTTSSTNEQEEFTPEPPDPAEQYEFKQALINQINQEYKPDDGSFVQDIDFAQDSVTIADPEHHKTIILSYKDLPKNKRFKRVIKKSLYDNRVAQWFTQSPEKLKEKYPNPATIDNHTFAKIVDSYIQLYGQEIPRTDNRREFVMPGEVIDTQNNTHAFGTFEYTFYQNEKNGPWILFHRLFRPHFKR